MASPDKTILFLKKILAEEPENIEMRIKLASAYLNQEDCENAMQHLDLILRYDPQNKKARALVKLCEEEFEDDEVEETTETKIRMATDKKN
jgi:thioredoxin-like negative regulator of GroEL